MIFSKRCDNPGKFVGSYWNKIMTHWHAIAGCDSFAFKIKFKPVDGAAKPAFDFCNNNNATALASTMKWKF